MAGPRLIDIGGRNLWAQVQGAGPVVVLNGGGGAAGVGRTPTLEAALSPIATVVTYDRAGLGRSDPSPDAPTATAMAADLAALLRALGLTDPAILVGVSLGGLLAQIYACNHPQGVLGLVLVDPTPSGMFAGFGTLPAPLQAALRDTVRKNAAGTGATEAQLAELEAMAESCEQTRLAIEAVGLPNVPVTVIALSRPETSDVGRAHRALADRPDGRLILVEGGAHETIVADQGALIAEAVRQIAAGGV